LQHKEEEEEAKQEEEKGDGNIGAVACFFLFFSYKRCLWTNKQTKETRKKKVRCLLGSHSCSRVGPTTTSTAPLLEAPLQAPAPSSLAPSSLPLDVSGALAME